MIKLISIDCNGAIYTWDIDTKKYKGHVQIERLYEGMNITGVTGISAAQRASLLALGAIDDELTI